MSFASNEINIIRKQAWNIRMLKRGVRQTNQNPDQLQQ